MVGGFSFQIDQDARATDETSVEPPRKLRLRATDCVSRRGRGHADETLRASLLVYWTQWAARIHLLLARLLGLQFAAELRTHPNNVYGCSSHELREPNNVYVYELRAARAAVRTPTRMVASGEYRRLPSPSHGSWGPR